MAEFLRDGLTLVLLLGGAVFFAAGTVGLLRFPDPWCRLHALTKADNVGLGLTVLALLPQVGSAGQAAKLILVWLVALVGSATVANLFAGTHKQRDIPPEDAP